ncbi:MAG: universal stress protein [Candidatus Dormibacteraeota bacterium]|nr:universal stress protein [Candidatus Dormibacteraeota bacterium]
MATGLVVVGVGESNPAHAVHGLRETLGEDAGPLLLCHVIDNGARGELGMGRGFGPHRRHPGHHARAVVQAERDAAAAILSEAARAAARSETRVEEGEPGRVLCRLAGEVGAALLAVGARNGPGPDSPEPHSIGHTARFVLDHAPCPVLLVRRGRPPVG